MLSSKFQGFIPNLFYFPLNTIISFIGLKWGMEGISKILKPITLFITYSLVIYKMMERYYIRPQDYNIPKKISQSYDTAINLFNRFFRELLSVKVLILNAIFSLSILLFLDPVYGLRNNLIS